MSTSLRLSMISLFSLGLIFSSSAQARTVRVNLAAEFGCCEGIRGDVNNDGEPYPDITDLVVLIDYIWGNGSEPECDDEADVNGDKGKEPDVVDVVYLIDYLWFDRTEPPGCPAHADCYPQSHIGGTLRQRPQINAVNEGNPATGVKLKWQAACPGDWRKEAELEYSWEFFGPYTDDELLALQTQFTDTVYETIWGHVLEIGDVLTICDSVLGPNGYIISCDTLWITANLEPSETGTLTERLNLNGPEFRNSPFNRLVEQSSDGDDIWVSDTSYVLYDAFRHAPQDTTVEMNFIFQVTARDVNEGIEVVPSYEFARVVDPRFERDILVIDFNALAGQARLNSPAKETIKAFWDSTITNWYDSPNNPSIRYPFDIEKDYLNWGGMGQRDLPLQILLKYKVLILYSDGIFRSDFLNKPALFSALDIGVSAWLTMRSPAFGALNQHFREVEPSSIKNGLLYSSHFGVEQMTYSGWACSAIESIFDQGCPEGRIEDFIEAQPVELTGWPELTIDTARLHSMYNWDDIPGVFRGSLGWYPYYDTTAGAIGALPEVNWSLPSSGTEPLYTYRSLYGATHPFGEDYSFEGKSVMHRLETGWFRTVHSNFTPLAIDPTQMQIVVDSVLNWLYDPTLTTPMVKKQERVKESGNH